jgi:hypothetical protein
MNADRARASAASVLDAMGDDFWAWWRTTVGGALLLMLGILVLAALNIPMTTTLVHAVMLTSTLLLGYGVLVVTYLASKRASRWQQVQAERRLPSRRATPRQEPLGLLIAGTLAWVSLATGIAEVVLSEQQDFWTSAAPWMTALLVMGAAGAVLGRWDRGWVGRLGALIVFFVYLGSQDFVGNTVKALSTLQLLGIGSAALMLLVWSFRRPAGPRAQPHRVEWPTWQAWAHYEPLLLAWYRERFKGPLGMLFALFLGVGLLMKPFLPGKYSTGTDLVFILVSQAIMLWVAVAAWQVPEQHWRYRLQPRIARQRRSLAPKLWWAQFRWMAPLGMALAMLNGLTHHAWPEEMDVLSITHNIIQGLPWLVANLALLASIATLWVGLRRANRELDLLLGLVALGAFPLWIWIGPTILASPNWSGRADVLVGMLVSTALALTLATWVWQRGSLAGMERWSIAGQSARF